MRAIVNMTALFSNFLYGFAILLPAFHHLYQVEAQPHNFTASIEEKSPVWATRGTDLILTCRLTVGLPVILTHTILWLKESRFVDLSSGEPLLITRQGVVVIGPPLSDHYDVSFLHAPAALNVTLTIKSVQDADDGRYICRVTLINSLVIYRESMIEVIVPHEADSLEMQLGNMTVLGAATNVTASEHTVQITAKGSNPPANISVYLGSKKLNVSNLVTHLLPTESKAAGAPRFSVYAEATLLLSKADNGKTLRIDAGNKTITTLLSVVVPVSEQTTAVTRNHETTKKDNNKSKNDNAINEDVKRSGTMRITFLPPEECKQMFFASIFLFVHVCLL